MRDTAITEGEGLLPMSDHKQFSADVATLNKIAEVDLPALPTQFNQNAVPLTIHAINNTAAAAFSSKVPEGADMAKKFEALLDALGSEAAVIKDSLTSAAASLKVIADNYERVDKSLSGK